MPNPTELHSTTQQFLDIYDITNDLVIMKDGSTSLIITVSAMNFGLLAEEEQDAIIYAYAGLLNSLNYPIQIVVKSQTKDATKYLNLLKEQEDVAQDRYKSDAIHKYRDFVSNLIRERNVLDKKFYVVIPASSLEMGLLPPQTVVPGVKKVDVSSIERSIILEKAINILEPKRDHLISQFARIGLAGRQLTTQEIIQLFYTSYNPEAAEGQQITNTSDYTTALVQAQTPTNLAVNQLLPSSPGSSPMTDTTNYQPPTTPVVEPQTATTTPLVTTTPPPTPPPAPTVPPSAPAPDLGTNTPPLNNLPNAGGTPAATINPPNPAVPPTTTTATENPVSPMAMPDLTQPMPISTPPLLDPTPPPEVTPPTPTMTPPTTSTQPSEVLGTTSSQPNLSGLNTTPQPTMTPPVAPTNILVQSTEIKEDPQNMINDLVQATDVPKVDGVSGSPVVPTSDPAVVKEDVSAGVLPPLPEI